MTMAHFASSMGVTIVVGGAGVCVCVWEVLQPAADPKIICAKFLIAEHFIRLCRRRRRNRFVSVYGLEILSQKWFTRNERLKSTLFSELAKVTHVVRIP